jgi:hypothetical protein
VAWTVEWLSPDGRICAIRYEDGSVLLESLLADCTEVVTWAGPQLAAADWRLSFVGTGDLAADVARHAEALADLEAAGADVVVFSDVASRVAARRIEPRHFTSMAFARRVVTGNALLVTGVSLVLAAGATLARVLSVLVTASA